MATVQVKRWIPRIVALAVVAGLAAFLVIRRPWEAGATPITFSTVQVGKGTISAQVTASGTLSARSTVTVGAQVSGRITELHADFNDKVKKGQIVAKLDEQVLREQIDQQQAAYDLAVANERKAEVAVMDGDRQYKRQLQLQSQQLVAGATVEAAEVTYKSAVAAMSAAKAGISQAAANLKQANINLAYATIISPVDGVVLSRAVEVGQTVQSSMTAPTLFTIAEDLSRMQIDTSVAESDVGRLGEGMKAQFAVDAFPGKTFEGKVRQVRNNPTTTSGVVTYDAVIDVENNGEAGKPGSLRPGMTANVTFVLDQVQDAIKIPNAALRFKPSRDQMMAIREAFGGGSGHRGSGRRNGSGSDTEMGVPPRQGNAAGGGPPGPPDGGGPPSAGGQGKPRDYGDKKPLWKLVDGKPKMVLIKPGLTDGSSTQLLEGDLEPGDQLITEIQGLPEAPKNGRKVGVF